NIWRTTSSPYWQEYLWKCMVRLFKTPAQRGSKADTSCCRLCGNKKAGHYHVFWSCPKLNQYWEIIKQNIDETFKVKIPLNFETMFLGKWTNDIKGIKKYMWNIRLVASKKAITKKWMSDKLPNLEDWINIVEDISQMERLTLTQRLEYDSTSNGFIKSFETIIIISVLFYSLCLQNIPALPCGKALYSYEGKEPGDLQFSKGDIIILRRKVDDNWYHGELNGCHGFLPASYIQLLRPLSQTPPQGKALYDFEVKDKDQDKDCLAFSKDEVLTVIRRVDENWAEGMLGDKIGIFPILYVELNETAKQLMEIDKPTTTNAPGPSSEPSTLGSCSSGPSPCASPSNGNGSGPRRGEGKKNAKKRHSFTALSVTQRAAQLNNRHSMEISNPVLISSSDPRAAARIQVNTGSHFLVLSKRKKHLATSYSFDCTKRNSVAHYGGFHPLILATVHSPKQDHFFFFLFFFGKNVEKCCFINIYHTHSSILTGLSPFRYLALYAYKPQKADELELRKGEMYRVTEKCQDGWFKGTSLRTAASGVFPGNYVTPVSRAPFGVGSSRSCLSSPVGGSSSSKVSDPSSPGPSSSRPSTPLINSVNHTSPASSPQSAAAQLKNCLRSGQHTVNQRTSMQLVHSPPAGSPERPSVAVSPLRPQSCSPSRQSGRPLSMVSPGPSLGPSPLSSPASRPLLTLSSPLSCLTPPNVSAALLHSEPGSPVQPPSPGPSHVTIQGGLAPKVEKKERKAGGLLKLLSGAAAKKKPRSPPSSPPTHVPSLGAVATDPSHPHPHHYHPRSGSCPMASQGRAGSCPIETDIGAIGLEPLHRKSGSLDTNFPMSPPAARTGNALMVLRPEPKPLSRE
ncbi:hypothetical protein NL108_002397, partial [Boleophthalmus pectinirostris]